MVARVRRRIEGERGSVVCDTRHLPIVVMQWRGGIDPGLLESFGRWMDDLLAALEIEDLRIGTVVDLTCADEPSPEVRRALVELRSVHQRESRGRVVIDVVATERPALRGVVEAVSWINPRAPAVVVSTMADALRRCRTSLQRAGVAAPLLLAEEFEQPT